MQKIISLCSFLLLFSCADNEPTKPNEDEETDGGPCAYDEEYFPVKIVEIDSSNKNDCELTLIKILEEDTIYYSHYNPNLLESNELHKKQIELGDTITFVEMNIKEGSCNPFIQTVSMELFNSKLSQ